MLVFRGRGVLSVDCFQIDSRHFTSPRHTGLRREVGKGRGVYRGLNDGDYDAAKQAGRREKTTVPRKVKL